MVPRHPSDPWLSSVPSRPSYHPMVRAWGLSRVYTMRLSAGRGGPKRRGRSRAVGRGDDLLQLRVGSLLFGRRSPRSPLGVGWPWTVLIGLRRRPPEAMLGLAVRRRIFAQSVDHVLVILDRAKILTHTTRSIVPSSAVSWPILGVIDRRSADHCDFSALFPFTAAIGPVLRNCAI